MFVLVFKFANSRYPRNSGIEGGGARGVLSAGIKSRARFEIFETSICDLVRAGY